VREYPMRANAADVILPDPEYDGSTGEVRVTS
jgi:hypothetical protein